jgi:hypothetical protein
MCTICVILGTFSTHKTAKMRQNRHISRNDDIPPITSNRLVVIHVGKAQGYHEASVRVPVPSGPKRNVNRGTFLMKGFVLTS